MEFLKAVVTKAGGKTIVHNRLDREKGENRLSEENLRLVIRKIVIPTLTNTSFVGIRVQAVIKDWNFSLTVA